ncbi:hypothetical protein R3P38DRAFT_2781447 [Favolaschia claudopus]|uniref:Uncharacterized protein n=1 Tax=Favolaschia claudopus TaxID=2862362 RepID=A0AAW0B756_9AGAR
MLQRKKKRKRKGDAITASADADIYDSDSVSDSDDDAGFDPANASRQRIYIRDFKKEPNDGKEWGKHVHPAMRQYISTKLCGRDMLDLTYRRVLRQLYAHRQRFRFRFRFHFHSRVRVTSVPRFPPNNTQNPSPASSAHSTPSKTKNANGKRTMTSSEPKTRRKEHLKLAREALERWRLKIFLHRYSKSSLPEVGIMPDQILTSLASKRVASLEEMLQLRPCWMLARRHGQEVLATLRQVDDRERISFLKPQNSCGPSAKNVKHFWHTKEFIRIFKSRSLNGPAFVFRPHVMMLPALHLLLFLVPSPQLIVFDISGSLSVKPQPLGILEAQFGRRGIGDNNSATYDTLRNSYILAIFTNMMECAFTDSAGVHWVFGVSGSCVELNVAEFCYVSFGAADECAAFLFLRNRHRDAQLKPPASSAPAVQHNLGQESQDYSLLWLSGLGTNDGRVFWITSNATRVAPRFSAIPTFILAQIKSPQGGSWSGATLELDPAAKEVS